MTKQLQYKHFLHISLLSPDPPLKSMYQGGSSGGSVHTNRRSVGSFLGLVKTKKARNPRRSNPQIILLSIFSHCICRFFLKTLLSRKYCQRVDLRVLFIHSISRKKLSFLKFFYIHIFCRNHQSTTNGWRIMMPILQWLQKPMFHTVPPNPKLKAGFLDLSK